MTKAPITLILAGVAVASTAAMFAQTATAPEAATVEPRAAQEPILPQDVWIGPPAAAETITSAPGSIYALPEQVAHKALNGDFGLLAAWQQTGYRRLLKHGARKRIAWVTHYWTGEPGVGTTTASGRRVETGRTAAMLEPRDGMPWGTFVLVDLPRGYQLRQVWDTGSRRNKGRAQRKGAETWIDLYMPGRTGATYVRPIWIERS